MYCRLLLFPMIFNVKDTSSFIKRLIQLSWKCIEFLSASLEIILTSWVQPWV